MKKIFLIPLLTLVCSVMAFAAEVVEVATYDQLRSAVAAAKNGDVIELTADINYGKLGYANNLNITKSITLDGKGHTLTGAAQRESSQTAQYATVWVNIGGTDSVTVVFKDIKIINNNKGVTGKDFVIHTRGKLKSITLENVELDATACAANATCLQIGGNHYNTINVAINDCKFVAGASSYAFSTWNTIKLETRNTKYSGYCAMYFHQNGSYTGTKETRVDADACDFDAPNVHSGETNAFGVFAAFSENIKLYLHNCGMNAQARGTALQAMLTSDSYNHNPGHYMEITGDNSHINGDFTLNFSPYGYDRIEIMGGTYSVDPSNYEVYPNSGIYENFVPEGYEVKEITMEGVATPLYRVVKEAKEKEAGVMYDLNDLVAGEGVANGNNPVSSFDLSNGTDMTLNQATTVAGYVSVSDDAVEGATTVTVGNNQSLVINNGLDVQGESQVIVESGATLKIGEGGINTEDPENIVIEANENGAASLLLDPTITVNQTPYLTVRMTAKQIGRDANGDFFWHRFAMPVASINSWGKEGSLDPSSTYPTYLYAWDYNQNEWASITPSAMEPLQGYTLTLASNWINADGTDADAETDDGLNELQDVVYTFKGNLVGNENKPLDFKAEGFNFFGNSYTGYMDVKTVLEGLEDENIDKTAYMWNADEQIYVGVSLTKLNRGRGLEDWQKEVAPMQTFILRLRGADDAEGEEINYASAIWGNPNRYGNNSNSGAGAPRRNVAAISDDTYMEIVVKAANGKGSSVDFTESADNSDAFESGYDVEKYMNEKRVNLFATVDGMNLSSVVTDNIEGKTLSLQTNGELAYTMTFKNVEGEEYAIRDNATGRVIAIEEGATYEFAAQPNSLVENRFEIIPAAKMPTAIDDVEVKANVKGIYTIMGQYLGENFNILPAGVYVVDGVKIVK